MKINSLVSDRVPLEIEFPGGKLKLVYNPHKITPAFLARLYEVSDEEFYGSVVTEWDLEDENGERVSFTAEALQQVPTFIRRAVAQAVLEAQVPNSTSAGS